MCRDAAFDLALVGGGYAAAVSAIECLRLARRPLQVLVFEPREHLGRGVAYDGNEDAHWLNTRAKRMSLVPGDDDHFTRWARTEAARRQWRDPIDEDSFVPRHWFGRYVTEQLERALRDNGGQRVHRREPVTALQAERGAWRLHSASGTDTATQVVLATGNLPRQRTDAFRPPTNDPRVRHVWDPRPPILEADAEVLIEGTGLSMVDALLALHARGHRGVIHAVSRHAVLPLPHSERHGRAQPLLARRLRVALRELRLGCQLDTRSGRPWQWRLDANRHHAQAIWLGFSEAEKARFLRHARSLWDVHRHRIADVLHARLQDERNAGTLRVHRGRVQHVQADAEALQVRIGRAGNADQILPVGLMLSSLGFELDYRRADSPLIQDLLQSGTVRPGACQLGLDTDATGRLRAADGRPWPGFFTLGTPRVGQLWESTAAHEIRLQAAELAGALVDGLGDPPPPRDRRWIHFSS